MSKVTTEKLAYIYKARAENILSLPPGTLLNFGVSFRDETVHGATTKVPILVLASDYVLDFTTDHLIRLRGELNFESAKLESGRIKFTFRLTLLPVQT